MFLFLDDLLMVETEVGTEGFTVLVKLIGGNYNLHKVNRIGAIKLEDEAGNTQTIVNLNIKPLFSLVSINCNAINLQVSYST